LADSGEEYDLDSVGQVAGRAHGDPLRSRYPTWKKQERPEGTRSVWARRYVAGLSWGAPVVIQDVGGTCAVAPILTLARDGRAFVAWTSTVACDFTQGFGSYVRRFE